MVYSKAIERRKRIRRTRIIKGVVRLVSIMVIFTAALTAVLSLSGRTVNTKAAEDRAGTKYYKSVMVQSGDTLWSIADKYMDDIEYIDERDFIKEVKSINHMDSDNISYGTYIIVPYFVYEQN